MATATSGYVLFDSFMAEVLQYVHGAPSIMVRNHIRNSIIEFLERSMILKKDPSSFYLEDEEHTYTLKYSADRYRAIAIKGDVRLGEDYDDDNATIITETTAHALDNSARKWRTTNGPTPSLCWLTEDTNKIRFYPIPNQDSDDEIYMTTCVTLKRDQTEIDEWIWEKWEETVQAGALRSLLAIPGATWFNFELAQQFDSEFKKGIRRARAISLKGTGEVSGRVVPQNFVVGGDTRISRRSTLWE